MKNIARRNLLLGLAAASALLAAWGVFAGAPVPAQTIWEKTISGARDRYCGWPTVCDIGGGEFAAIFSGDRNGHVCPWGKVRMVRSRDDGETWSESETLCNTILDDRDAGLLRLADGTLVLFWFTSVHYYENEGFRKRNPDYGRHFEKLDLATVRRTLGSFSRRSTDGGRTWEAPVRLPASAPHGGIQLRDGRLIVVGTQDSQVRGHLKMDPEEKAFAGAKPALFVAASADAGRSWREIGRIPTPFNAYEPHLLEGADGVLRCYARTSRNLLYTSSGDGGRTWSSPTATDLPSWHNPPALLRLKDGRTLLTYGRRVGEDADKAAGWRTGVYARIGDRDATPDGFAASPEVAVWCSDNRDLGYASSVECADGAILTVFYGHTNAAGAVIVAVKWRYPSEYGK